MSKVVGTVETPLFAGNGFHRSVLLNLLPGIDATEESIASASKDASASQKRGKSAKKPTVYGTITMAPSALESVLVAILSEGVMPPSISASFLRKAVSSYSQLLPAKVKRGLDIASRCYQRGNEPPLAFAVGRASAETVECMVASGAGQDWMNVLCSPAWQAQLTAKVESRWRSQAPVNDLPDIAVSRENCRILRALHHSGICATNLATLFEAALYSNPGTLEFLLNTQSWSPVNVRDALCLQSAICLMVSLSPPKSSPAHITDEYSGTSPHQCPACRNELDFRHSLACPVLSTAFQMFPHPVAVASEANPLQSTATEPRVLSLQQSIGQDIREAHSKEELWKLGMIEFPSASGTSVRGWHFHALLVMECLQCPLFEQFFCTVVARLCGELDNFSSCLRTKVNAGTRLLCRQVKSSAQSKYLSQAGGSGATTSSSQAYICSKFPFTTDDVADALGLHFAYCLLSVAQASSASRGSRAKTSAITRLLVERQMSTADTSRAHPENVCNPSINRTTSNVDLGLNSPTEPADPFLQTDRLLTSGVESFRRSLEYSRNRHVHVQLAVLDIVGHCVQEAQCWDGLWQLGQIEVATLDDSEAPLNGLLLHSLLVFGRLLPRDNRFFLFSDKVVYSLFSEIPFMLRHLRRHCLLRHLNPVRVRVPVKVHSALGTVLTPRPLHASLAGHDLRRTAQDGLEKQVKLRLPVRLLHRVCHPPAALALCRGSRGRSTCCLLVVQPHDCFT